jgi:ribosome recycling factor
MKELMHTTREKMNKTVEATRSELAGIRSGRASAALVEHIRVDYYGADTPLNQLAGIAVPEPRLLVITPWDKMQIDSIEKALLKADLGVTPNNDGTVIRIPIPPLNEERRRELVKRVHRIIEEGKVALRNIRRDANEATKKAEKNGDTSEDEAHRDRDEIQKITDEFSEKLDELAKKKEEEIMEV